MIEIKQQRWFRFVVRHWPWLTVVAATLLAGWIAHRQFTIEHKPKIKLTEFLYSADFCLRCCRRR
jgi:hypothetical protein